MEFFYIEPKNELKVYDPETRSFLKKESFVRRQKNSYWQKRLAEGSIKEKSNIKKKFEKLIKNEIKKEEEVKNATIQ